MQRWAVGDIYQDPMVSIYNPKSLVQEALTFVVQAQRLAET